MKIPPPLFIALALLASTAIRAEEPRPSGRGPEVLPPGLQPPASEITNDEAFRARRSANGTTMPKPVPKQTTSFSIAELSVFISHDNIHAILPKGSVIYCPDALATRVSNRAFGKPTPWSEFLIANRNWISTHEVTLAQVRGDAPLAEGERKAFATGGRMVIATFRGNPITVLPAHSPVTQP